MLGSVALVSLGVLQPASATLRHLAPSASEVLRQLSVSEELQAMLDSTPRPPDQLELLTKNHSPGMWASVKSWASVGPAPYINPPPTMRSSWGQQHYDRCSSTL